MTAGFLPGGGAWRFLVDKDKLFQLVAIIFPVLRSLGINFAISLWMYGDAARLEEAAVRLLQVAANSESPMENPAMKASRQDFSCHISERVPEGEGRYANNFKVGHNACEFVMDFGQLFSGRFEERFHSRIVTNPVSAKYFLEVLQRSITEYEKKFAVIPLEKKVNEAGVEPGE